MLSKTSPPHPPAGAARPRPGGRAPLPGTPRSALAALAAGAGATAADDDGGEIISALVNAARWVRSAPMQAREAAFERIAPMLSFLPAEVVERLRRSPKDDRTLDDFIRQLELLQRRLVANRQTAAAPADPTRAVCARGVRGAPPGP